MKKRILRYQNWPSLLMFIFCVALSLQARGQNHLHPKEKKPLINYKRITNSIVRKALQSWQDADIAKWKSMFAEGASLTDDGHPRDLKDFSTHAIGDEYFLTIDKVEDDGKTVTGHFHTKKYGEFIARFHFEINNVGKIFRLDIGMVSN